MKNSPIFGDLLKSGAATPDHSFLVVPRSQTYHTLCAALRVILAFRRILIYTRVQLFPLCILRNEKFPDIWRSFQKVVPRSQTYHTLCAALRVILAFRRILIYTRVQLFPLCIVRNEKFPDIWRSFQKVVPRSQTYHTLCAALRVILAFLRIYYPYFILSIFILFVCN